MYQPNHKERRKELSKAVDEDGNLFSLGEEDKVYLRRKDTREDTCLGKLVMGEKRLCYWKFEDERNVFKKTEAWSINYTVFEKIDYIIYETLKYSYTISKKRAEEFGEILKFGTEKKIYVPIIYWNKRRQLIDPVEKRRRNLFGDSWYELFKDTINSEYMSKIGNYLRDRRQMTIVYPDENLVFRAFNLTHTKQVKVVILGQEPYTDGSANGLAFGYRQSSKKRPHKSLDVVLKEVERDCYNGLHLDFDETLIEWAEQGVLLLNTVLTVERGQPKSHAEIGWQRFIKIALYELMKDPAPKVYMIWGGDAFNLYNEVVTKYSPGSNVLMLRARHPASDLYNKDAVGQIIPAYPNTFSGCDHFKKANEYLRFNGRKEIKW